MKNAKIMHGMGLIFAIVLLTGCQAQPEAALGQESPE
jgi:uncharacterized lipoprotein YajG